MDPQISFFNNFFIKNESHGTIYIFKNYFTTVFFSFQFQLSIFNCIQTDPVDELVLIKHLLIWSIIEGNFYFLLQPYFN